MSNSPRRFPNPIFSIFQQLNSFLSFSFALSHTHWQREIAICQRQWSKWSINSTHTPHTTLFLVSLQLATTSFSFVALTWCQLVICNCIVVFWSHFSFSTLPLRCCCRTTSLTYWLFGHNSLQVTVHSHLSLLPFHTLLHCLEANQEAN